MVSSGDNQETASSPATDKIKLKLWNTGGIKTAVNNFDTIKEEALKERMTILILLETYCKEKKNPKK